MQQTTNIHITGMSCQGCVNAVNQSVLGLNGVSDIKVDLTSGQAIITYEEDQLSIEQVLDAIYDAGFDAQVQ